MIRPFYLAAVSLLILTVQVNGRDLQPATQRVDLCLNGQWQGVVAVDENTLPRPLDFNETLPVPGIFNQWFGEMPGNLDAHRVWYRLAFVVPAEWGDGRRVHVEFRSVDHYAKVYVNRAAAGEHYCGLIPFQFDITAAVEFGASNELLVYVEDSSRTISTPAAREKALAEPWAKWRRYRAVQRAPTDYPVREAYMPGINGDVYLKSAPPVFLSDAFVKPSVRKKKLDVQLWVDNAGTETRTVTVKNEIVLNGKSVLTLPEKTITVPVNESIDFTVSATWPDPELWGYGQYGSAVLYFLRTELIAGQARDTRFTRFGFREVWAEGKDLYFNGRKWFIQGDCDDYHRRLIHTSMRAWLARFFQAERQQNVNNVRNGWGPAPTIWFEVADEMGMTLEPSTGISGYPNPTNRKTDQYLAAEYTKAIRNHPSVVIISSNNEAASQGGGAISPGNDPEVWKSLKLAQDTIRQHDGTRLVSHQGSPRIMLAKKFDLDFPVEIWNIHPYGDPLLTSLRRHIQAFGYDRSVPCVLGEVVGKKVFLPKDIELLKEYPEEACNIQMGTARYWAETIRDIRADGVAGIQLLSLMARGYWGPISENEVSAGPFDGVTGEVLVPWPSRSGPGIRPTTHVWYHKLGLVNCLLPDRPIVVPNVIAQAARDAYRAANDGEDLPPVPDRRVPELIVTVTAAGEPAAQAYVFLEPLDGQATIVRGVMADDRGAAWFVLNEPGRYRVSSTLDGRTGNAEVKARWGSLKADPMPWGHVDRFALVLK